jgi:hypothetical protein
MSRANTCTHTNAHAHTHERMLASLPLSPPCRCHRGVGTHICSYSVTRALPLPRSPSSRGPLPAGGDGPTDTSRFPVALHPRHYAGSANLPMRLALALAPASRRVPTREWTHGSPPRTPAAHPRLQGCVGTGSLSSGAATSLRDRALPLALMLARKRGPRIAERIEDSNPTIFLSVTRRKIFVIFCLLPKTDSPWALL